MKLSGTLLSGSWVPFWVALGQVGGCGSLLESCRREQGCAGVKRGCGTVVTPSRKAKAGHQLPAVLRLGFFRGAERRADLGRQRGG